MPSDVLLLAVTAVLAVVALAAAAVALRASRQVVRARADADAVRADTTAPTGDARPTPEPPTPSVTSLPARSEELAPRVVEGRVIVPPSREEVVATALTRPQVRLSVLAHGLAHALRPESRDRIAALVRREYRQRRRGRLRAGRRAARAAHGTPTLASDRWLGELEPSRLESSPQPGAGLDTGHDQGRAIGA